MRSLVVFLTHDFKPVFLKTLRNLEGSLDQSMDSLVLFDSSKEIPTGLDLGKISIHESNRHPSAFDPIGQAHNFYLDFFRSKMNILDQYDYIWILENDVYYHGNIREFFDIHSSYEHDLLVPEFGLRHKGWCWLGGTKGIKVRPIGATAVVYRASSAFMKFVVENVNSNIVGHMEVVLPHICLDYNFSVQQFIPDHICSVNTFRSPFLDLIERDIQEGTNLYVQKKIYHPVKL
jgi:hypothetical protein